MIQLPEGPFDAAIIDPPWRWKSYSKKGDSKSPQAHYDTMGLEEIKAMPVNAMLAKNAVVYLWATSPMLLMALEVAEAWKLTYVSQLAWDKKKIGTGYWTRNQHEIVLICKKGKPRAPAAKLRIPSVISERGREHSRKPDALHRHIESWWPDSRKVELRYPFIGGAKRSIQRNHSEHQRIVLAISERITYSLGNTWGWPHHKSRPRLRTVSPNGPSDGPLPGRMSRSMRGFPRTPSIGSGQRDLLPTTWESWCPICCCRD